MEEVDTVHLSRDLERAALAREGEAFAAPDGVVEGEGDAGEDGAEEEERGGR